MKLAAGHLALSVAHSLTPYSITHLLNAMFTVPDSPEGAVLPNGC